MVLPTLPKLPPRQEACLTYMAQFFVKHRHMPSQREICEELGIKSTSASPYVAPLVKKGYLHRLDEASRASGRNYELTNLAVEKLKMLGVGLPTDEGQFSLDV